MHPLGPAEGSEYYYYSVLFFLPMNYRCLEAVHPRGPAERAHEHYWALLCWIGHCWAACLQDALPMITTGKVRITCPGAKKEEGKEARTLSEPSGRLREAFGKPEKVSTSLKEKMTVEREHAIRASPMAH